MITYSQFLPTELSGEDHEQYFGLDKAVGRKLFYLYIRSGAGGSGRFGLSSPVNLCLLILKLATKQAL